MMLVHMEVHSKGYFLMRIQSKFEAGWKTMFRLAPIQPFYGQMTLLWFQIKAKIFNNIENLQRSPLCRNKVALTF